MRIPKKIHLLPLAALVLGFGAFGLRAGLYALAVDQQGLLISGHPLTYALWAVVAAGAAFILWNVCRPEYISRYPEGFAPSASAAVASAILAVGLLITVLNGPPAGTGSLAVLWRVLGFLSAPALVWAGISRNQGKQPFFGTHALLSLFLLFHMIGNYQHWSGNPQLQDYIFELLASLCLTLFSYYCAASEADMGSRRMFLATGLLAVLLCPAAFPGSDYGWLYMYGAVWAFNSLCTPTPPPKEEVNSDDAP